MTPCGISPVADMGEAGKEITAADNGTAPAPREYSATAFARSLGIARDALDAHEREGRLPSPKRRMRGEVAHRLGVARNDELGDAAHAFDEMAAQLQKGRLLEELWQERRPRGDKS